VCAYKQKHGDPDDYRSNRGNDPVGKCRPRERAAPAAVLIPLVAPAAGFVVFCLADIARAEQVRGLPRWAGVLPAAGLVRSAGRRPRQPA